MPTSKAETAKSERKHKATFARDKMNGGWNVRVEGPTASRFAGREVPVTRFDGTESMETLDMLLWAGQDKETGKPVGLYSFTPKPKVEENLEF